MASLRYQTFVYNMVPTKLLLKLSFAIQFCLDAVDREHLHLLLNFTGVMPLTGPWRFQRAWV